ncbi:MAG: DNA-directed RNA polymerase subunit H [Candidatus Bathyarchaeia archaeon]|jgi:DNA-directed RNA polymerase subunit H
MPRLKDTEKERSYDLFEHQLVPKHELLSKKEAAELMEGLHIQPHQLPYIKVSDPTSLALTAEAGDILRVTRKSATAGEVVVYRYVVEG